MRCRSCGKEIFFLKTKNEKLIPINADSISEEDKRLLAEGKEVYFDLKKGHVTHFADCPSANRWRRKK